LKSMMDLVRADVVGEKLEKVVDGMFKEAGLESRDESSLSLQDFIRIMDKHKSQLEGASIGLKGVGTAPPPKKEIPIPQSGDDDIKIAEPQPDAAEPGLTESIGQTRYARARKTVHQNYRSRTTYVGAQPQAAPSKYDPDTRGHKDEATRKV
uniref:hypothetical protein n=1 Tax=Salmonella sp. s54836 TaxID=3159673 RepID=UPI00397F9788